MRNIEKLTSFKEYLPIKSGDLRGSGEPRSKNVGLLVDGPNMLRKEFHLDLGQVMELLGEYGKLKVGKVFLNQYASNKLIEAVVNQGLSPIIVAGDIDVQMAVEAFEAIHNPHVDIIAIMTRNTDFLPLLNIAKENGKETMVIGAEPGFSVALKNSADNTIIIDSSHTAVPY